MLRRLLPLALIAFVLPAHAFASDSAPASTSSTPTPPDRVLVMSLEGVVQGSAVQSSDKDRADWNARLMEAQNSRKQGLRYFLIGLGVASGGSVLAMSMVGDDLGSGSGAATFAALTGLGGGGLSIYGIVKWMGASGDIDDLDREGRQKGYLTLLPTRDGLIARVNFGF